MKRRFFRWAAMRCWRLHEVLSEGFTWVLSRVARAAWACHRRSRK